MKRKTEQKILTIIIVLALVALAVLVSSIVYEEEIRKNKNAVESTAIPTIENKDTNVEETPEKEENLPQEQEPTKEEYVGEEEKEAEQENVASQVQSKDEKAIELAKKEWGEDNSVTFNIEEKDGDKYYVAVKKDATTIKWYEVDTDKWTISEY